MAGFTFEVTVSAGDLDFTLPTVSGQGYNATVYWGDTSNSSITAYDDVDITHTYAGAGTYEIEIQGQFDGLSFNNAGDKLKVTDIVNWGTSEDFDGFEYLTNVFYGCSNIATLGTGSILAKSGLTSLTAAFASCGLTNYDIQSGFLDNCTNVTIAQTTFYNTGIASVPDGLLSSNLITVFNGTFLSCPNLQINPLVFYNDGDQPTRFLNKSINFQNCFNRTAFTGTQGTAPDLWNCDFGTGTPTKTDCFAGAGNSPTSLDNYKNIPVAWGGQAVSAPTITNMSDTTLFNGQQGVVLTVTDALPYQYDGAVEIANNSVYGSATKIVGQAETSWADNSVTITVARGDINLSETGYVFLTTDRGDQTATPYTITWTTTAYVWISASDGSLSAPPHALVIA